MLETLNRLLVASDAGEETHDSDNRRTSASGVDSAEPSSNKKSGETLKKAESETHYTAIQLEDILDEVSEPIIVLNDRGEISHINTAACDLFETTRADAMGQLLTEVHAGETLISQVLDTGEKIEDKNEAINVGDTSHTISRTVSPITDETGTIIGGVETATEVTDENRQRQKVAQLESYQESVLADLRDKITRLATGDLTIEPSVPEPPAEFEEMQTVHEEFTDLSDLLMKTVTNYREVMSRLTRLADDLEDTSSELSANSEEVSASIEEISQSTDEMADGTLDLATQTDKADMAVSSLTATIEEITASVQEIDAETSEASKIAIEGYKEGTEAVGQIRTATDATSEIKDEVETLEGMMHEVGEALEVISGISEQTNLLALNATIEAARAGDAGSGFAVVADEVKSLAEESKQSASRIEEIITRAQNQTTDVAEQISHTNQEVSNGADAVETVVDQLEEIESAVEQTSAATAEVSKAIEGQAQDMDSFGATIDSTSSMSEEISASIEQISAGIEQQSTATDQVADRAVTLSSTSEELYDRIDQFRLSKDDSAKIDG